MKNYVDSSFLKDKFIKNFIIKCGKIIVNFSSGKKKIMLLNDENIRFIDDKMSSQIIDYSKDRYNKCIGNFCIYGFFLLLFISFFTIIILKVGFTPKILLFIFGILGDSIVIVNNIAIFKDVKKNMLFIKERDMINKLTESIPDKIDLERLNINGYSLVEDYDNSKKEDHILVNDIDNMSYMDVKRLVGLSYDNLTNKGSSFKIKKLVRKNND